MRTVAGLRRSSLCLTICALVLTGCAQFVPGSAAPRDPNQARSPVLSVEPVTVTQSVPAPTIVVAHSCDGLSWNRHVKFWGGIVKSWGYNAVFPDSFRTRDIAGNAVCKNPRLVDANVRAQDMLDTLDWVERQPWHAGRVGLMGFSHGGSTVIRTANLTSRFAVGVAYYPGCVQSQVKPLFPVQIHIGTADDWTLSARCVSLASHSPDYDLFLYEGATHAFDSMGSPRVVLGHHLAYDPNAAALAAARSRAFFSRYLGAAGIPSSFWQTNPGSQ